MSNASGAPSISRRGSRWLGHPRREPLRFRQRREDGVAPLRMERAAADVEGAQLRFADLGALGVGPVSSAHSTLSLALVAEFGCKRGEHVQRLGVEPPAAITQNWRSKPLTSRA